MGWLLVLGAKSDIARAITHKFAEKGFNIYLAARDVEECRKDVQDLRIRYSVNAQAVEFDALNYKAHKEFYESLNEKPLGVVCAVGYMGDQKGSEKNFEEAKKVIDTNYTGCMTILNVVANDFEERGEGFIIGISSVAGDRGRKSNYIYGSAKAGFSAYLSGLRNRLFKSNAHVMTVKPGFVKTKMTEGMNLPGLLMAKPEAVAEDIFKAWEKKKDIVYTKWLWRHIMMVIKNIPERVFKRMQL